MRFSLKSSLVFTKPYLLVNPKYKLYSSYLIILLFLIIFLIIKTPRYPKCLFPLNSLVTSSKLLKLHTNQTICLESVQRLPLAWRPISGILGFFAFPFVAERQKVTKAKVFFGHYFSKCQPRFTWWTVAPQLLKNIRRTGAFIREFKQIATAGADTAAGSKFPQKCGTAHVRRLHPTVADRAEKRLRMSSIRAGKLGITRWNHSNI